MLATGVTLFAATIAGLVLLGVFRLGMLESLFVMTLIGFAIWKWSAASSRSTAVLIRVLAWAAFVLVLPFIALVPFALAGLTVSLRIPLTWLGLLLLPVAVAGVVLWRASRPGASAVPRSKFLRTLAFIAVLILGGLVAMIIAVRLAVSFAPKHGSAASAPRWESPKRAHIGGTKHSVIVIHDSKKLHYVLYYPGDFDSTSSGTTNERTHS